MLEKRERILQELKLIKQLRDRERLIEDYDILPVLNSLLSPSHKSGDLSSDSSDSSDEMSEEEKDFYEQELHADYDELTSGYTTISSNKGDYAVGMKRPYGMAQLRNIRDEQKQEAPPE